MTHQPSLVTLKHFTHTYTHIHTHHWIRGLKCSDHHTKNFMRLITSYFHTHIHTHHWMRGLKCYDHHNKNFYEAHDTHAYGQHMDKSCSIRKSRVTRVMSHMDRSHVSHMSHTWMSHVSRSDEPCHTQTCHTHTQTPAEERP